MHLPGLRIAPVLADLLAATPVHTLAQGGPDELWETTMTMQADGTTMPAMTQRVCSPRGKPEGRMEVDGKCRMVESKQSGTRFVFRMVCSEGPDSYTGSGEMEDLNKDAYRGFMTASGTRDGEKFTMRMDMTGKRVGTCDAGALERKRAAELAALDKQQKEEQAKLCDGAVAGLDSGWVFGSGSAQEVPVCRDRQGEFCARAAKVFKGAVTRDGWTAALSSYREDTLPRAATFCRIDYVALRAPLCREADNAKDWKWLRDSGCPEAAALRRQHCAGRSYSAVDPRHAELCAALGGVSEGGRDETADAGVVNEDGATPGTGARVDRGNGTPGVGSTVPPTDSQTKPSTLDKLKDGAQKLRKFLNF